MNDVAGLGAFFGLLFTIAMMVFGIFTIVFMWIVMDRLKQIIEKLTQLGHFMDLEYRERHRRAEAGTVPPPLPPL